MLLTKMYKPRVYKGQFTVFAAYVVPSSCAVNLINTSLLWTILLLTKILYKYCRPFLSL